MKKLLLPLAIVATVVLYQNWEATPSRTEFQETGAAVSATESDAIAKAFEGQQSGVVHWTQHDPQGQHEAGWVRHRGQTYQ
jgi:uncharacterized protein DUF3465